MIDRRYSGAGRPAKLSILGLPLHAMLMPFPVVCFIGALLTDITYANSADIQWSNFSAWLLAFGEFFAVLAALAALVDTIGRRAIRSLGLAWPYVVGLWIVVVLGLFNNLVHSHDGWTSVVPTGLTLSVVTVLVLIPTAMIGMTMAYRYGVGVAAGALR